MMRLCVIRKYILFYRNIYVLNNQFVSIYRNINRPFRISKAITIYCMFSRFTRFKTNEWKSFHLYVANHATTGEHKFYAVLLLITLLYMYVDDVLCTNHNKISVCLSVCLIYKLYNFVCVCLYSNFLWWQLVHAVW